MLGSRFDDVARGLGRGASRRTIVKGLASGIAGLLVGSLRSDASAADRTLTICHANGNADSPYESMTIQQAEFNLHARHGDFLRVECCVDGDCSSLEEACGSGTCQSGYCVQVPKSAGTICGENLCLEQGMCDGAMNCIASDIPVVCEPIDACHLVDGCDPVSGCVQIANEGASCTPDETHDGVCDANGICQPVLICTAGLTCSSDGDCLDGDTCVNGGCFPACAQNADCTSDCSDCQCQFMHDGPSRYCVDSGTYIGLCQSDSDCPAGTLCSQFFAGENHLCTQSCSYKR